MTLPYKGVRIKGERTRDARSYEGRWANREEGPSRTPVLTRWTDCHGRKRPRNDMVFAWWMDRAMMRKKSAPAASRGALGLFHLQCNGIGLDALAVLIGDHAIDLPAIAAAVHGHRVGVALKRIGHREGACTLILKVPLIG